MTSLARRLFTLHWQIRFRCQQIRRALCYAAGHLSQNDAALIVLDCEHAARSYSLATLTPDSVLDMAVERYGNQANALNDYLPGACATVANKWDSPSDDRWHARNWALEIALDAAGQNGIAMTHSKTDLQQRRLEPWPTT